MSSAAIPSSALVVRPAGPLHGSVQINGAKNSALKLMAATVLAPGRYRLRNVPRISDVDWMGEVLTAIGVQVSLEGDDLVLDSGDELVPVATYEQVERMRASTALLGPLLARCGEAHIALPGGDDFGARPIDLHLDGLRQMGAQFELSHGTIHGRASGLRGARVVLEYPSVGATETLMLAATLASGRTVIDNAAREPEITDLGSFLNRMGARVVGAGSPTIEVDGVSELRPVTHEVIPDRVEAVTFLAAVGAAGGEIELIGARFDHLSLVSHKLGDMGIRVSPTPEGVWAMCRRRLQATSISTLPYPGIATDYLPLLVPLMAVAQGTSFATENLFRGRFRYVGELARMGARIDVDGHHMVVEGVEWLSGAPVRALDIRAGAGIVIAGLRAEGETVVWDRHHIDRGYEDLGGRLASLGADVSTLE